jgi:nucleoside-diphosphate-sugar epimerase
MKLLVAGATGAIGRPLIRCLKERGHSVFGLVHSSGSESALFEMGAEAVTGDALDAASVKAVIQRIRPDAIINELTSLPRHYTPEETEQQALATSGADSVYYATASRCVERESQTCAELPTASAGVASDGLAGYSESR